MGLLSFLAKLVSDAQRQEESRRRKEEKLSRLEEVTEILKAVNADLERAREIEEVLRRPAQSDEIEEVSMELSDIADSLEEAMLDLQRLEHPAEWIEEYVRMARDLTERCEAVLDRLNGEEGTASRPSPGGPDR